MRCGVRAVAGTVHVAEHYLYRGLAVAVALGRTRRSIQQSTAETLRDCLARLTCLCRATSPHNFGPHAALLEAEAVRLTGRFADALKHYNRAIELAETEGHTHLVGLANERAALLCLTEEQRRLAGWYLAGARAAYEKWGATAKVAWLDREYATLLRAAASTASAAARKLAAPRQHPSVRQGESFDIAAALHASRIIASGENTERRAHALDAGHPRAGRGRDRSLAGLGRRQASARSQRHGRQWRCGVVSLRREAGPGSLLAGHRQLRAP